MLALAPLMLAAVTPFMLAVAHLMLALPRASPLWGVILSPANNRCRYQNHQT
jgi:hypothetical protein